MEQVRMVIAAMVMMALPAVAGATESPQQAVNTSVTEQDRAAFKAQVQRHLKAIHKRDLKTYSRTISRTRPLVIVFRNGNVVKGYDEAVQLHRNWFGMKWTLESAIEETEVYGDTARAQVSMKLAFPQGDGSVFVEDNLLTLIFEKQNGEWLLVFDQNTPVVK